MKMAGNTAAEISQIFGNKLRKIEMKWLFSSPTAVKIFRAPVIVIKFRLIKKSLKKPVDTETPHINKYGSDEYSPLSLIENRKTSLIYFGRSLDITKKPQSCPICAHTSAIIGTLVMIEHHGVGGKSLFRFNCPISISRNSRSSLEMNGCEPGLL